MHGYFDAEGHLHPVERLPVKQFLEQHAPAAAAVDDDDLFGAQPAEARGRGARSRSRSPRRLPPGWEQRSSRSKPGVVYYVHAASGRTQFERPLPPA